MTLGKRGTVRIASVREPFTLEGDGREVEHEHTAAQQDDTPLAKRLTISPKAAELLAKIEEDGYGEVFIAAESCMKEHAILQAIIDEGRRATVVSYPSVTLYPDELDAFAAEHFGGLRVWLVPDNDYGSNQQVRTQMFIARDRLRAVLGGRARSVDIAAPPLVGETNGKPIKMGADDALAVYPQGDDDPRPRQFTLDDFVVLDRNLGTEDDYIAWKHGDEPYLGQPPKAQAAVITWMALLSDADGVSTVTDQAIAALAWPEDWAKAEAADAAAGHDHKRNRATDKARTAVRKRASRVATDMYKKGVRKPALTVEREGVILDNDGEVQRIEGTGLVLKVKTRRIAPDLWERLKGTTCTIGSKRTIA
jgi:hypothetical protein